MKHLAPVVVKKTSPKKRRVKKISTTIPPRAPRPKKSLYSFCLLCMHTAKKHLKKKLKKPKGFTLIELMVVMAIVTILATAGISSYMSYIKKANDTKTLSLMRELDTIVMANLPPDGTPPTVSQLQQYLEANGLALESVSQDNSDVLALSLQMIQALGVPAVHADSIALKNAPGGRCSDGNQCIIGYTVFSDNANNPLFYGIFANFRSEKSPTTRS